VRVLYLSYDGALDPLGRSQVVPYLEGLSAQGIRHDLITFEKPARAAVAEDVAAMRQRLAAHRIGWHPLPYTKRPPVLATAWDLARGIRLAKRLARDSSYALIHARSYPAAVIARAVGRSLRIPYVFDIRGLYPEERVDGGLWKAGGVVHRVTKRVEADLYRDCAAVVTLTEASLPWISGLLAEVGGRARVTVIPTCVDLELFTPAPAPTGPFRLAYFGSVGTWYLLDAMLAFGAAVLDVERDGRLGFVVNSDPELVRARAVARGIAPERLDVRSVRHEDVPSVLAGAHATFFFIHRGPSAVGFHQTKLGESLALGIPVAANRGVGDTAAILEGEGVGVVVDGFEPPALAEGARRLVALAREPCIRERCRAVAEKRYGLADGVRRYAALYREVAS